MKWYCYKCNEYFDNDEIEYIEEREYRGECHGTPAYEYVSYEICPNCGSELEEADDEEVE